MGVATSIVLTEQKRDTFGTTQGGAYNCFALVSDKTSVFVHKFISMSSVIDRATL